MQRDKAADQRIELLSEFVNLKECGFMVKTDMIRVMQVMLGLQSNAIKFTKKGYVKHRIQIVEGFDKITHEKCKFLQCSVIDTGIGIEPKDQKKLFKLFGFVKNSQQLNKNGIGLGLVILDKITNQFGSKITFQSTPNEGSVFTFQFQLEQQMHFEQYRQKA